MKTNAVLWGNARRETDAPFWLCRVCTLDAVAIALRELGASDAVVDALQANMRLKVNAMLLQGARRGGSDAGSVGSESE